MSTLNAEVLQNGTSVRNGDSINNGHEVDEYDFSRFVDRPRLLNLERQRSCDERSLNDLPVGFSPHPSSRADNFARAFDNSDSLYSPGRRSGCNTPLSHFGYGMMASDPHPMIAEAWDDLRRSLVYFRGQPVGTIAALDNSDEKLNYDQVKGPNYLLVIECIVFSMITFHFMRLMLHGSAYKCMLCLVLDHRFIDIGARVGGVEGKNEQIP